VLKQIVTLCIFTRVFSSFTRDRNDDNDDDEDDDDDDDDDDNDDDDDDDDDDVDDVIATSDKVFIHHNDFHVRTHAHPHTI